MQKYISIDEQSKTNTQVRILNDKNEVHGTLKTRDAKDNDKIKDVNEIFVNKKDLSGILSKDDLSDLTPIDISEEDYSLEDVAKKLNDLISKLKGLATVLLIGFLSFNSFALDPPGKQKLGTMSAKTYVVTNEVDPAFSSFKDNKFSVEFGYGAKAGPRSVAIGVPLLTSANGGPVDGWSMNYLGPVEAPDRSVAIGDSAKAMEKVSVAIGNQANVRGLQPNSGTNYTYKLNLMQVITVKNTSGSIVSVTTNKNFGSNTYTVDTARYERLPIPNSNWTLKSQTVSGNTTTQIFEQNYDSLYDIAYISDEEKAYYDKIIKSGQGDANLMTAQYGVAVGSRAYVSGYHGAAFGHYAHVSRPFGLAIGSEAHSYSEGGQAIGFDTDIATNSPFSLAVGMNASIPMNTTNAIVIGVPNAKTDRNNGSGAPGSRPTAMKSNSINFVYHGDGLNDFFIDNKPITDRMASEVSMIGSAKGTKDSIETSIKEMMGIPKENQDMVFFSGNGGLKFFTMDYIDEIDSFYTQKGNVESIEFNGMSLPNIIAKYSPKYQDIDVTSLTNKFVTREELEDGIDVDELEIDKLYLNGKSLTITNNILHVDGRPISSGGSSDESKFEEYHAIVTNQARIAFNSISNSTNLAEVKSALMNFFTSIK